MLCYKGSSLRLCSIKILTSKDNPGCVEGSGNGVLYSHALSDSFFIDKGQLSINRTCFQSGPSSPTFTARAVYEMANFEKSDNNETLISEIVFSNMSVWQASSHVQISAEESTVSTSDGQISSSLSSLILLS